MSIHHELDWWARPVLDAIIFLEEASAGIADVLRDHDEDDLKNLVGGLMVRIDPYKAPEQLAPNIEKIARFLYARFAQQPGQTKR